MTKAEFAEYCHNLNSAKARTASVLSQGEVDQLLMQYALSQSSTERTQLENQLNAAGVYIYSGKNEYQVSPLSEPADVTVNAVICSYNDNTGDWSLVGGGHWNNVGVIWEDTDEIASYVGQEIEIGGFDAMGILIVNNSGTVPTLKASFGQITNGAGNVTTTIDNPSTYDTSKGIGYLYQDYLTVINSSLQAYYTGYGFAAVMRFDSSFVNWNGTARAFYYHTWDETSITGLGFSVGVTEVGVDVSWANEGHSFPMFSRSDTTF